MWKDQYLMTNVLSYSYIFIGKTFFHRIIGFPSQPIVRVKPRTEIRKNISKYFSDDKVEVLRGAAIAPWIRLCLPSCPPGFESQAHHLHFFSIYIVQICPLNWNVKRICNSVSNNFSETWIRWSNVALIRLQSLYIYHLLSGRQWMFFRLSVNYVYAGSLQQQQQFREINFHNSSFGGRGTTTTTTTTTTTIIIIKQCRQPTL